MPHKRPVRERGDARRATDLAPKIAIVHEPIPKSVSRVLDAEQIRREHRKKKRRLGEVGHSDEGNEKRRYDATDMKCDHGETTALKINPDETVAQFNRRVESSMLPLVRAALRQSSAQARRVRREAVAQQLLKQGKQKNRVRQPARGSPKQSPDPSHADETVAKEFQASAPRRLNDVAQEPPTIKRLPRGAIKNDTAPSGVLSMAQQAMIEEERDKAVKHYRELKARKLRESSGVKLDG